jgi:hypothetical protein
MVAARGSQIMVATPEIIPSDLALEIEEDLSPDRFVTAARAFFGYVQEIGRVLAPSGEEPRWIVHVREGSTLLGVEAVKSVPRELLDAVYSRAESGIRHLTEGDIEGSRLSETALKHVRALSELAEGSSQRRPTRFRIWVRHTPIDMDASIAKVIQEDWRIDYHDFGTVEGRLETIQDREGRLQLQIRDGILRQTVRCYFSDEMLPKAFEMFRKRVEVTGIIHYRRNGTPVSIEASHIERLPDDSELPTLEDVRGILKIGL